METVLSGKRVAILATDGFEQSELFDPKKNLESAGAQVDVIAPKAGEIKAWHKKDWGKPIKVDATLEEVSAKDYDALVLPGGVMNPDTLRINEKAVAFVKGFVDAGKPIGAICHGPWTLIEAGAVQSKQMTSWPSLKSDLQNAGALWVDQQVVVDNGLVTSRKPEDIPAFCSKLIEEIQEGKHLSTSSAGKSTAKPPTEPLIIREF